MGCHPSHWRTHIVEDGYCTTNQKSCRNSSFIIFQDIVEQIDSFRKWLILPSGNLLQFAIENGDLVRGFTH